MEGGVNPNAHRTRLQPNHQQTGESRKSVQDHEDGGPLTVLRRGERAGYVVRNITIKLCIPYARIPIRRSRSSQVCNLFSRDLNKPHRYDSTTDGKSGPIRVG